MSRSSLFFKIFHLIMLFIWYLECDLSSVDMSPIFKLCKSLGKLYVFDHKPILTFQPIRWCFNIAENTISQQHFQKQSLVDKQN